MLWEPTAIPRCRNRHARERLYWGAINLSLSPSFRPKWAQPAPQPAASSPGSVGRDLSGCCNLHGYCCQHQQRPPSGAYTITITYTRTKKSTSASTPISETTTVTVAITAPTFTPQRQSEFRHHNGWQLGHYHDLCGPCQGFTGTVALTCAVLPVQGPELACSLSPASVMVSGTTAGTSTLTVTTSSNSAALSHPLNKFFAVGGGIAVAGLLFFGIPARRRSWRAILGNAALRGNRRNRYRLRREETAMEEAEAAAVPITPSPSPERQTVSIPEPNHNRSHNRQQPVTDKPPTGRTPHKSAAAVLFWVGVRSFGQLSPAARYNKNRHRKARLPTQPGFSLAPHPKTKTPITPLFPIRCV